jgi:hypothetical protein
MYGLIYTTPELKLYEGLFWLSHIFFIGLSIALFYLGNILAASANKYHFSQFTLLVVLTKMLSCIVLVVGYHTKMQPSSHLFLVPLALVYVLYTVFETYVMAKIGNTKQSIDL